ncbi:MAG: epoxide hydrolase [Actinomycetota bacterium]|nr:MAG: epoxide hydrolase [Actinomycetota bacterium]
MTEPARGTSGIEPFRLEVPEAELAELRARIAATRWPDEIPGVGWRYGVPGAYLRELADYWRDGYDWRRFESRLNELGQHTTTIDGARVHFLHHRSPEPDALPLILTHGWPGSVVEFLDVVEPLRDPRAHGGDPRDAFHLVIPSIPGYGLSGPTHEIGWDVRRIAAAWAVLMQRLGYPAYGAQGGDWGSWISWELGLTDPGHVVGVHVNMLATGPLEPGEVPTPAERAAMQRAAHFRRELSGYLKVQATRPQTLAYGLADSPVGQLAWIVDQFREWTDAAEVPEEAVDRDLMLTNVMLYWLTGTVASSARLYHEVRGAGGFRAHPPTTVPTGVAVFPADVVQPLRRVAERTANIVRWSQLDRGGHFAAMEEPDLFVAEVRAFFRLVRSGIPGNEPRRSGDPGR